jgi:hypothetical protein
MGGKEGKTFSSAHCPLTVAGCYGIGPRGARDSLGWDEKSLQKQPIWVDKGCISGID